MPIGVRVASTGLAFENCHEFVSTTVIFWPGGSVAALAGAAANIVATATEPTMMAPVRARYDFIGVS